MEDHTTPDKTQPGIDHQGSGFLRKNMHHLEPEKEVQMQEAVKKDRDFYDSPENPGRDYNCNDQAFSQSSAQDFVKTTSSFTHADGTHAKDVPHSESKPNL